jgi:hypothetical protein
MVQEIKAKWSYTGNKKSHGKHLATGLVADVFDLLFTPIPQLILGEGVASLGMRKRETCPGSDILENVSRRANGVLRGRTNETYLAIIVARLMGGASEQTGECAVGVWDLNPIHFRNLSTGHNIKPGKFTHPSEAAHK